MDLQRRALLAWLGVASFAPAVAGAATPSEAASGPGPATTTAGADGEVVLEARAAPSSPLPTDGTWTSPLRYGEAAPGPTLRLRKGAPVRVRLINRTNEPTGLDWHGVRFSQPAGAPPGPAIPSLSAGQSLATQLTPPDSGTYWFHPGLISGVPDQTARGLAGVLIVEEAEPPRVDADKVVAFSDHWRPARPGSTPDGPATDLSHFLLVNGSTWPEHEFHPPGSRLRLRVVNASTRHAFAVACEGARPYVVAIDGQPSELFVPLSDRVPVGPGARFDLMLDLPRTPGLDVRLTVIGTEMSGQSQPASILTTRGDLRTDAGPIAPLPPNPRLPRYIPLEKSTRATIMVQTRPAAAGETWSVNGASGGDLPRKPIFVAKRNTPVTLGLHNASAVLTAFRLHGHAMRLLHALDDGWEPYWRDSILVPPGATHHVAFLADNPGRWLIESPFAEQAVNGLRTWFEVL